MNETQKKTLLKLAKNAVEAAVTGKSAAKPDSEDSLLKENRGCFVTLKNQDRLRGCIGRFTSDVPLAELVGQMAEAAAVNDPRFLAEPVTPDELKQLDIEISVLSALEKTDEPLSLRLGVDGIYIKRGYASGCFLPQVAEEAGWSKEEFLSCCCSHKAGLPADTWKDEETEVYLFTAEVFGAAFNSV